MNRIPRRSKRQATHPVAVLPQLLPADMVRLPPRRADLAGLRAISLLQADLADLLQVDLADLLRVDLADLLQAAATGLLQADLAGLLWVRRFLPRRAAQI